MVVGCLWQPRNDKSYRVKWKKRSNKPYVSKSSTIQKWDPRSKCFNVISSIITLSYSWWITTTRSFSKDRPKTNRSSSSKWENTITGAIPSLASWEVVTLHQVRDQFQYRMTYTIIRAREKMSRLLPNRMYRLSPESWTRGPSHLSSMPLPILWRAVPG